MKNIGSQANLFELEYPCRLSDPNIICAVRWLKTRGTITSLNTQIPRYYRKGCHRAISMPWGLYVLEANLLLTWAGEKTWPQMYTDEMTHLIMTDEYSYLNSCQKKIQNFFDKKDGKLRVLCTCWSSLKVWDFNPIKFSHTWEVRRAQVKRRRTKSGQNRIRTWFRWLLNLRSQTELCSNKYKYLVYRQAHTAGLNSGTHGLSENGKTVLLHLMLGSTFNSHLFLQ